MYIASPCTEGAQGKQAGRPHNWRQCMKLSVVEQIQTAQLEAVVVISALASMNEGGGVHCAKFQC